MRKLRVHVKYIAIPLKRYEELLKAEERLKAVKVVLNGSIGYGNERFQLMKDLLLKEDGATGI